MYMTISLGQLRLHPPPVLPDRAVSLPTCSHFLIVNKIWLLSLSLSLSLPHCPLKTRNDAETNE